MIELTWRHLEALSEAVNDKYRPYKIALENVSSITTPSGETLLGENLLVATFFFDDQRDGEYQSRYLLSSSFTGGKALALQ